MFDFLGKRNYLPSAPLNFGFALLFKVNIKIKSIHFYFISFYISLMKVIKQLLIDIVMNENQKLF
jgi:hypothetical protein